MNKRTCRAASMRTRAQVSFWSTTPGVSPRFVARSTGRGVIAKILVSMLLLAGLAKNSRAGARQSNPETSGQLKKLSLAQLGGREVTSISKEPVTVARTPAAIYVLTQEDIRLSGATSIPEVLRLVPGVEVARIDSDKWAIGVRGFGSRLSRSVLVLIDGRTVWGANAVNAVINIITKSAKDTLGMLASIGGGNVDQGIGSVRYGGGNGKAFNFRVYGKAFSRGPEFHSDKKQFDVWEMGQAGFRMDWTAHARDALTLQGDIYNADDGERVSVGSYAPPYATIVDGAGEVSG